MMHCVAHPDQPAVGACVSCGHMVCAECKIEIDDRIYCKTCIANRMSRQGNVKRLFRSQTDKKLAGVCGGLGVYFEIDSNIIRVAFVL
ncbi:MAG: PspC domain-containing protein, partial [bacterium]